MTQLILKYPRLTVLHLSTTKFEIANEDAHLFNQLFVNIFKIPCNTETNARVKLLVVLPNNYLHLKRFDLCKTSHLRLQTEMLGKKSQNNLDYFPI